MSSEQQSLEELQKRKAIAEAERAAMDAEFARDETKKKLDDSRANDAAKEAVDAKVAAAKAAKELADAEKLQVDAELARDEVKKKLATSHAPEDPATKVNEAKLNKAKAAKNFADAEKSRADSELAALKAKLGDVPSSGIAGNVTLGQGAGSIETAFLAARAACIASEKIAQAISAVIPAGAKVLIFPAGENPTFQTATKFFAQRALVLQALTKSIPQSVDTSHRKNDVSNLENVSPTANDDVLNLESVPMLAGIGVGLEAVTKLLGFFRSDFDVHGVDLTADNMLLAKSVIGELLNKCVNKKPAIKLYLKSMFNPVAAAATGSTLEREFKDLDLQREIAANALNDFETEYIDLQTKLSKITGETVQEKNEKLILLEQAKRYQRFVDKLKSALASYDAFVSGLVSQDAELTTLVGELEIWNTLMDESSLLLIVKVDKAGGSSFIAKNLWTSFGAIPLYVMGGVIASYTLFQGNTGTVLASGTVPVHSGFWKVNKINGIFK